jgi:hypothetical protein
VAFFLFPKIVAQQDHDFRTQTIKEMPVCKVAMNISRLQLSRPAIFSSSVLSGGPATPVLLFRNYQPKASFHLGQPAPKGRYRKLDKIA